MWKEKLVRVYMKQLRLHCYWEQTTNLGSFFQIIANNKRNNEKCNIHLTKFVCFFLLLLLVVSFEVIVVIADKEWAMGSCSFYAYPAMANKARL